MRLQPSERLGRLVEQLLDLSRLESGDVPMRLEPVPIAPLIDRVLTELRMGRSDREQELTVSRRVEEGLPPVQADAERLHQVLFNLVDNAYRLTPDGGSITVRARQREGWCEVSVRDTGPGIGAQHLSRVFERFYRVDPARSRTDGGTGIGLAIARSIVGAHGGRIWAESDGRSGSTFRFVVPFAEPPAHRPAAPPVPRLAVPGAARRAPQAAALATTTKEEA
jgi:signal transduction histidine kinase